MTNTGNVDTLLLLLCLASMLPLRHCWLRERHMFTKKVTTIRYAPRHYVTIRRHRAVSWGAGSHWPLANIVGHCYATAIDGTYIAVHATPRCRPLTSLALWTRGGKVAGSYATLRR